MFGLKKMFGGGEKTPATSATGPEAAAATAPGSASGPACIELPSGEVKFTSNWAVDTTRFPDGEGLHPEKLPFKAGSRDGARLKWEFYLRKKGIREEWISLYLRLETKVNGGVKGNLAAEAATDLPRDEPRPLLAAFNVTLLDPATKQPTRKLEYDYQDYLKERFGLGHSKFLKVEELPQMVDSTGKLYLHLEFSFQGSTLQAAHEASVKECLQEIMDELGRETYRDVIIKTSDAKEISAHRVVLGARSKFFKDELERIKIERIGNRLNSTDKYEVEVNYPQNIMGIITCHIYNGYLSRALLDPEKVPYQMMLSLLQAADQFQLQHLKNFLSTRRPDIQGQMDIDA